MTRSYCAIVRVASPEGERFTLLADADLRCAPYLFAYMVTHMRRPSATPRAASTCADRLSSYCQRGGYLKAGPPPNGPGPRKLPVADPDLLPMHATHLADANLHHPIPLHVQADINI
jgi:hypothetical protein